LQMLVFFLRNRPADLLACWLSNSSVSWNIVSQSYPGCVKENLV